MPFRNKVRTAAVVAVLAVAIGLALAMLVANQAVGAKVQELNASVGTVLTVNPAGGQGFEGGGEPLTAGQAATAAAVPNVTPSSAPRPCACATPPKPRPRRQPARQAARRGQGGPGGQSARRSPPASRPPSTPARWATATRPRTEPPAQPTRSRARSLPITATGIGAEVDSTGKALALTEGTGLGDYTAASTGPCWAPRWPRRTA